MQFITLIWDLWLVPIAPFINRCPIAFELSRVMTDFQHQTYIKIYDKSKGRVEPIKNRISNRQTQNKAQK